MTEQGIEIENLMDIQDTTCPLCRKPLASDEYHNAIKELEKKVQQSYSEQDKTKTEKFEHQLKELKEQHEASIKSQHENHTEQLNGLKDDLQRSYKTQLSTLEDNYYTMTKQNQKQFEQLEKQLEINHKKDLTEKTKQITLLKKEQDDYKKSITQTIAAQYEIKSSKLKEEVKERDIQIGRFSKEVESLKNQLSQRQSELQGEAGELDLYEILTHAFSRDFFRRQKRGTSSGDLIQQIRTTTGPLDTTIVYDNKAASTVSKTDIEKAKRYKKIHATNYVLIVCANLPKKAVPNGLIGQKDGIILVHPSIVVEVAKQIRSGIIEVSKYTKSKEDQKVKQTLLYEYIIGQEFSMVLQTMAELNEKMYNLQSKEEKDHQTLWKNRKSLQEQLVKAYNDISSGIESITQEDSMTDKIEVVVNE